MPESVGVCFKADAVADLAAYTAHASGATTVTSNAATDLDTTAAQVAENTAKINAILAALRAANLMTT